MQETLSHAIEVTEKSFTLLPKSLLFPFQTKITLNKQSLFEVCTNNTQGVIVVGKNQQKISAARLEAFEYVGKIYSFLDRDLYQKIDDSASDDDTYKPYPYHPGHQRKAIKTNCKLFRNIFVVTEPCITKDFYNNTENATPHFMYDVIRGNECLTFTHNQAIEEAGKDLTFCYTQALNKGLTIYNTKEKNISFPTLGADVGFPRDKAARIAINTIFEFIKDYPNKYAGITFFVQKRSDFALYKFLLLQKIPFLYGIYLLCLGHRKKDNILSLLPTELIDYIASLSLKSYILNLKK